MSEEVPIDVLRLIYAYMERFGDSPPVALRSWDWIRENIGQALKQNKPLPEPDIPEGAVI